jgi:hypothetical protein
MIMTVNDTPQTYFERQQAEAELEAQGRHNIDRRKPPELRTDLPRPAWANWPPEGTEGQLGFCIDDVPDMLKADQ